MIHNKTTNYDIVLMTSINLKSDLLALKHLLCYLEFGTCNKEQNPQFDPQYGEQQTSHIHLS